MVEFLSIKICLLLMRIYRQSATAWCFRRLRDEARKNRVCSECNGSGPLSRRAPCRERCTLSEPAVVLERSRKRYVTDSRLNARRRPNGAAWFTRDWLILGILLCR